MYIFVQCETKEEKEEMKKAITNAIRRLKRRNNNLRYEFSINSIKENRLERTRSRNALD